MNPQIPWLAGFRGTWGMPRFVEASDEVLSVGDWDVPTWAEALFTPSTGHLVARAEIESAGSVHRASITKLTIGDGSVRLTGTQLHAIATALPDLPFFVLFYVATFRHEPVEAGSEAEPAFRAAHLASLDPFIAAMRKAGKTVGATQREREDEVLRRWETEFKPAGMNQRQAAAAMQVSDPPMAYDTFRRYKANAEARRKAGK